MATAFSDLGLSDEVFRAVTEAGYQTPTPIQEKAIPYIQMGRDLLGCAQTGTGKTASFTLPMIDILSQGRAKARMPRSVILAPTRELAAQVAQNFETYGKYTNLTMALLIGGVSMGDQQQKLDRGVDVLIATPGRLIDHCERGHVILKDTKVLVIDEGDRMLDMGFIPDVEKIVALMPPLRQTLMFSATMPKEIRKLAEKFLTNPKEVSVDAPSSTADTIEQRLIKTDGRQKRKHLNHILDDKDIANALVFCNRKRDVATLYRSLEKSGYNAGALHGDMDQYKRLEWLDKFKKGEITILVCSDVAARGLDIPSVSHVINYDVPTHSEDYVHRIGRTGRAGRKGVSITLATDADQKYIQQIEQLIGRKIVRLEGEEVKAVAEVHADTKDAESAADSESTPSDKPKRGGRGRKSDSKPKSESKPKQESRTRDNGTSDRPKRGGRGRGGQDGDAVPDVSNIPFGETDLVPAFLRR